MLKRLSRILELIVGSGEHDNLFGSPDLTKNIFTNFNELSVMINFFFSCNLCCFVKIRNFFFVAPFG